jgi:hypothetical protein
MDQKKLLTFLGVFRSTFELSIQLKETEKYTDLTFLFILDKIQKMYKNLDLSLEEQEAIKKRIDSEYQIYQPDGVALLDDYEHQSSWFTDQKSQVSLFYWERYRNQLFRDGFSTSILKTLDSNTTDNLMNLLGNPNEKVSFCRKGLVVGDVQSGKTSNYIGLMTKAADAGYKVIILLTGTIEALRKQTQIRVEEGFIGYDVDKREWVGVGINSPKDTPIPKSATSRTQDYTSKSSKNTLLNLVDSKIPLVLITKKNATTLKNIRQDLTNLNIIPPAKQIDSSLLIIDDEADNASVNTNDKSFDPTIINSEIRNLTNLFTKSNYVGFTATPFANVFIDPESETDMLKGDLFPKDFIYAIDLPNNYFGSKKIFLDPKSKHINTILDSNEIFPIKHKKEWDENFLFPSLIDAINSFLVVNAIRDINEGNVKNSHRSMLINVSRFIKVQEKIFELVSNEFERIRNAVSLTKGMDPITARKNQLINNLYQIYLEYHFEPYKDLFGWEEVFKSLYEAIKNIEIFKVPPKDKKKQLDYQKHKADVLRAIVIGGLALSRGLTLEGLSTSYLYRNTATFDVLMQMGRWFGYRDKPVPYENLCKIWILKSTEKHFIEISKSINELRTDLKMMYASKKTPKEFGIRVRNESDSLGITDRNKMRNSKKYIYSSSFFGKFLETPFITSSVDQLTNNLKVFRNFVSSVPLQKEKNKIIGKKIPAKFILDFLSKIHVHELNRFIYFDPSVISDFIKNNQYEYFDVGILGGDGDIYSINSNLSINLIERSFDIIDNSVFRISGNHRKLSGPTDFSVGLSKEQIDGIDEISKKNSRGYLIKDRNPLILFFPLKLRIDLEKVNKDKNIDFLTKTELAELNKKAIELHKKIEFVLGVSVAFPVNDEALTINNHTYYINISTHWWNLMKELENEEDE